MSQPSVCMQKKNHGRIQDPWMKKIQTFVMIKVNPTSIDPVSAVSAGFGKSWMNLSKKYC